ncbi:protein GAMETE EXPRESSED 3 [Punica granatum]|uniref:Protein GAMETE EXPRESSED 3 n=1 Tax=Punica granatum TaxID=22663 RepID=A0A6P8D3W8_PUNGR|nr:protein GAMETE EXPRESSED 3 [Punica granatum]
MSVLLSLLFFLFTAFISSELTSLPGDHRALLSADQGHDVIETDHRLSKALIGDDGRVYACSGRDFFAFEGNGTIAWTVHLNYTCNGNIAPVHGGRGKIYLVAEDRVLKITFPTLGTPGSGAAEVFFGPDPGQGTPGEIVGISVSTLSSSLYMNIKRRGLFAYTMQGQLLWSVGPVLNRFGYRQGCRKSPAECYYSSAPVIDQCEASIYIANTEGELYCLSARNPQFLWIRDFSSLDKVFTITAGNNGHLFVTIPVRALVLALDVSTGNILWQQSVGPLSTSEYAPVADSNGYVSIGSLDGCLYSISPTGTVKKFPKLSPPKSVLLVSPIPDCSGYAVYISQTEMEKKISRTMGEYTYISALRPKSAVFTLLVPATGSIYWSETYSDHVPSSLTESDLHRFLLDERILLAFFAASKTGNPLQCRSKRQKLVSSCSQATSKRLSVYTGDERMIILFLVFETLILIVLAGLVRFCHIFWRKKKLQGEGLGSFLEKRRSLQLTKKAFDRTITELKQKAGEEAVSDKVLQEIGDLVQEREAVQRKLSTTYSLGRDPKPVSGSERLLPLQGSKMKSYSFRDARKESVTTIFHTLSETSSAESSSSGGSERGACFRDKGKAPFEEEEDESSSSGTLEPETTRSTGLTVNLLTLNAGLEPRREEVADPRNNERKNFWLKRRTLSSTN